MINQTYIYRRDMFNRRANFCQRHLQRILREEIERFLGPECSDDGFLVMLNQIVGGNG